MVTNLVVRLAKAPEKKGGLHTSTWCTPKNTPALGVHQKISQHFVCTKKIRQHICCSPADTTRTHQIQTVATAHSGWASLIERTFAALLIGVKN